MTKELTPGQALDAMIDGDTVTDKYGDEWSSSLTEFPGPDPLGTFLRGGPFTIKPKTSKLTAEMVVKASRGAKVYQLSNPDWYIAIWHGGNVTMRCDHKGITANKIDYDADDWVVEE